MGIEFLTMSRPRLTSSFLAVVLAWMAAAPVLAVTCVPGHECPMGVAMSGPAAQADAGGTAVSAAVSAADCCLRSERHSESGTVQRPLVLQLEHVALVAQATVLQPESTGSPRQRTAGRPIAGQVPLYTLHSILLI